MSAPGASPSAPLPAATGAPAPAATTGDRIIALIASLIASAIVIFVAWCVAKATGVSFAALLAVSWTLDSAVNHVKHARPGRQP